MYTHEEKQNLDRAFAGDAQGSVPAFLLTDLYGTDWLGWEGEALRAELVDLNINCSIRTFDALQAIQLVLTSDSWSQQVSPFLAVVNAIGGEGADPDVFDPAEIDEIAWTLFELSLYGDLDVPSDDVKAYIAVQADEEGYQGLPGLITRFVGVEGSAPPVAAEDLTGLELSAITASKDEDLAHLREILKEKSDNLLYRLMLLPIKKGDKSAFVRFVSGKLKQG